MELGNIAQRGEPARDLALMGRDAPVARRINAGPANRPDSIVSMEAKKARAARNAEDENEAWSFAAFWEATGKSILQILSIPFALIIMLVVTLSRGCSNVRCCRNQAK